MFRLKLTTSPGNPGVINREFIGNPIDQYSETFDKFMALCELRELICFDENHVRRLIPKPNRVCRFCQTVYGEKEKFKTKAHLIPELLVNRYILSDFECDECNAFFSKLENDLANFFGVTRALSLQNARKGKIKFKSPDNTFIVIKDREVPADSPKLRLESHGEENDHFTLDVRWQNNDHCSEHAAFY